MTQSPAPADPNHAPSPTPHAPLPIWNQDLYLEFHRGCYTTHADQKRHNRQAEALLYQAELFAALATIATGATYPKTAIESLWKRCCLISFMTSYLALRLPKCLSMPIGTGTG
ncbi:MAG: hypothetical protein HC857_02940 [Synechococcales cyanobacterium RU_4_20]|nr:hypothetical protein [Synechococcales cyanobacterium RU_4_20]